MYAITGISGKVGGELARGLRDADQPVRAVVRDPSKGEPWAARGCDVALAEMEDAAALTAAFMGASAVFVLPPSEFDPEPGYPEARRVIDAVVAALTVAKPGKVLCLSTVGADAPHDNLLSQRTMMEKALSALPLPVTFLRPGWFLDNAVWDVAPARETGVIQSFLRPLDKTFPMVAAKDVGRVAAKAHSRGLARGSLWHARRRAGGPAQGFPQRSGGRLCARLAKTRASRSGAPGNLGSAVPLAGDEEPSAAHANAGRFQ